MNGSRISTYIQFAGDPKFIQAVKAEQSEDDGFYSYEVWRKFGVVQFPSKLSQHDLMLTAYMHPVLARGSGS